MKPNPIFPLVRYDTDRALFTVREELFGEQRRNQVDQIGMTTYNNLGEKRIASPRSLEMEILSKAKVPRIEAFLSQNWDNMFDIAKR